MSFLKLSYREKHNNTWRANGLGYLGVSTIAVLLFLFSMIPLFRYYKVSIPCSLKETHDPIIANRTNMIVRANTNPANTPNSG